MVGKQKGGAYVSASKEGSANSKTDPQWQDDRGREPRPLPPPLEEIRGSGVGAVQEARGRSG